MTYDSSSCQLHFRRSGAKQNLMMTKTDKFGKTEPKRNARRLMLTAINLLPESNEEGDLAVVFKKGDCGGKDNQMQVNHQTLGIGR